MPSTHIRRHLASCLALATLFATGWSQSATPAPSSPLPPDQRMRQAADAMSLTAPDMKPWHMRARFKYFADNGSVQREVVMEEWWANPDHYKTSFAGADFTRTEYGDGEKSLFTGSPRASILPLALLLHPLAAAARLDRVSWSTKELTAGKEKLSCYTEAIKDSGSTAAPVATYCFDESSHVLRLSEWSSGARTVFNSVIDFQGHSVAKQIVQALDKQKPSMTIDVDQLDANPGIDEVSLAPPADAMPIKRKITVSSGVMQGNKISGDSPRYPAVAKYAHVQGTVVIQATISEQGAVQDLKVVQGPPMLQQAALDAVRTWRYRPYVLNGDPVEVQTTMNIIFYLTH